MLGDVLVRCIYKQNLCFDRAGLVKAGGFDEIMTEEI